MDRYIQYMGFFSIDLSLVYRITISFLLIYLSVNFYQSSTMCLALNFFFLISRTQFLPSKDTRCGGVNPLPESTKQNPLNK